MRLKIDKQLVKERFLNSVDTYDSNAIVQKNMAQELIRALIEKAGNNFDNILEIGSGTGLLTKEIVEALDFEKLVTNDFSSDYNGIIKGIFTDINFNYQFIKGDAEFIFDFPENNNLIISNATFQWFEDVIEFLNRMHNALDNNGVIAFTTFGVDNFYEVNKIQKISLAYTSADEIIEKVSDNFELIFRHSSKEKLYFSSPIKVLQHIKNTGVNSIKGDATIKPKKFISEYENQFTSEKGVSLTYNPIYIILKKKS